MCNSDHWHEKEGFGFLVDTPEVRALVDATHRHTASVADVADRVEALKPAFASLLAADGWLPERYTQPDAESRMGGGIGQYALYRADDGSLCLFALVVPAGAATPVHDHLAWGSSAFIAEHNTRPCIVGWTMEVMSARPSSRSPKSSPSGPVISIR